MTIERYNKALRIEDWYMARYEFDTRHGTRARAYGYVNTRANAIAECLHDYYLIKSI